MASDKNKIAADCWRKGSEALSKQNWNYAIEMFGMAAKLVPDNLLYRQTLRGAEQKKYGDNGTGARMAGMKLMSIRSKIRKAKSKENWVELDHAAEEGLTVNPWDAQFNADLGLASAKQGHYEIALFAYDAAVKHAADNIEFLTSYAELLEDRGEYKRALSCWERIQKLNPLDPTARSKATQLQASEVMDRGGYNKAETTREVTRAYDYDLEELTDQRDQQKVDGPGMPAEARLQRASPKDPENKDNYLKLGAYYRREGKLEEAYAQHKKALEASGGDANIREQMEDIELDIMKQNVLLARDKATASPDDEAAQQAYAATAQERLSREIAAYSARDERYAADPRRTTELAQRLMRAKKYDTAIQLLQQAVRDNRIEAEVNLLLGECFLREKKGALARRSLEKAVPKLAFDEKPDAFKRCHYMLARLYEEAKDVDAAENHYSEVLAVDYDYKDTRDRLEKLQSSTS